MKSQRTQGTFGEKVFMGALASSHRPIRNQRLRGFLRFFVFILISFAYQALGYYFFFKKIEEKGEKQYFQKLKHILATSLKTKENQRRKKTNDSAT